MNKELELKFIRKAVIMACHSECGSYEEALQKELGFNCKLAYPSQGSQPKGCYTIITSKNPAANTWHTLDGYNYLPIDNDMEIIGQPITLSRVLRTLAKIHEKEYHKMLFQDGHLLFIHHEPKAFFKWGLDKKDDCKLQKPKTILAIAKLLGYDK